MNSPGACGLEKMIDHRSPDPAPSSCLGGVHAFQLCMALVKLLQRSDAEQMTIEAEAEEGDGRIEEAVAVERVDILGRALRFREREMPIQQLADIVGSRVVDRDLALWHCANLGHRTQAAQMLVREPRRRPREPGFDDERLEPGEGNQLEANEDSDVVVEMRRREEKSRVLGENCLLVAQIRDHRSEDRPFRRLVTKYLSISLAQWPLPDEQLVLDAPRQVAVRLAFARLGQSEGETTNVIPSSHAFRLGRSSRAVLRSVNIST